MKNLFLTISIIICTYGVTNNKVLQEKKSKSLLPLKIACDTLTTDEKNLVNDFLDLELASEKYKNQIKQEIIVIKEAGNGVGNLEVYEFAYKNFHSEGYRPTDEVNQRLGWILDTLQIKKLKKTYNAKNQYQWKNSDIKKFKISIMKKEKFRNIITSTEYLNLPEKIVLYITKPILIDNSLGLITLRSGSTLLGFRTINNYTALMNKINGKWQIRASYWDGSIE